MRRCALLLLGLGALLACREAPPPLLYQSVPVERRNIVVSAQAAGEVEPDVTVEVKSKASGEILEINVETGERVERGTLMVRVDQRQPRNQLDQAQAELDVANARLKIAEAQKNRSDKLLAAKSLAETGHEQSLLDYANARADVIRAQVAVENAHIQLEDTEVLAPITGTIIQKNVEVGQVISSPTQDVSGGTVLLRMADLERVSVRTLVDETDLGKIAAGLDATVEVASYPNRRFPGRVRKIEPMAVTEQNVTMFPVLVSIQNENGLLRPGMNCEVEIHVGRRESVLAIPNAALRTPADLESASRVLGLAEPVTWAQVAGDDNGAPPRAELGHGPGARALPPDVSAADVEAVRAKMRSGTPPTAEDRALMRRVRGGRGNGGRGGPGGRPAHPGFEGLFGGEYVVFTLRDGRPTPVLVRTGLTDLDYSEVREGLDESDSVLVLPSAGLIEEQERLRERYERIMGGGLPGLRSKGR